ncbi:Protein of unknown function [Leuconostoc citreum]|nr:Protein of unknown function [Leuconostoc citreum LBAE E16]CDX66580.1 Protein of unknown function [Leuconostoc citreum]
MFNVTRVG